MQVTVSKRPISQSGIFLFRASTADFPEVGSDWRLAQLHLYKDCSLPSETGGREGKRRKKKIHACELQSNPHLQETEKEQSSYILISVWATAGDLSLA